jgi:hypothetical protein
MDYLNCCGNICSLLSCYADFKNFVEKVCPCTQDKTEPPLVHEERKKITIFGRTVVELNSVEGNISQD